MKWLCSRALNTSTGGVRLLVPPSPTSPGFWIGSASEVKIAAKKYITQVDLSDLEGAINFDGMYWPEFPLVKSLDLTPLMNVRGATNFLRGFMGLELVDLTPLGNLKGTLHEPMLFSQAH